MYDNSVQTLKRSESVGVTLLEEKAWWERSDEKVTLRIKNQNPSMIKASANYSPERDLTP